MQPRPAPRRAPAAGLLRDQLQAVGERRPAPRRRRSSRRGSRARAGSGAARTGATARARHAGRRGSPRSRHHSPPTSTSSAVTFAVSSAARSSEVVFFIARASFRSRGAARPGFDRVLHPPEKRGGGAPTGAIQWSRLRSATRTFSIGARASRRSTLAFLRCGSALPSPALSSGDRAASSSRPGRSARRSASAPPEPAVASRSRGTPKLAPPSGSPLENGPRERDRACLAAFSYCSQ